MEKNLLTITTPRGSVIQFENALGKVEARLEWNPDFEREMTRNFTKAQMFVDSEVLRFCAARVPFDTGMLEMSGTLGTVVGSGEVAYLVPHAAAQYYDTATFRSYDLMRGSQWFERGKADERERILRGAQRIAGGGG